MKAERTSGAVVFLCLLSSLCCAQAHDVLCSDGNGSFEVQFRTGVKVSVGPGKDGGFTTRACQGTLSWDKQRVVVANGVAKLDVDLLGAEIRPGEPVVAFAEEASNTDCCLTYKIYSLQEPPRLLRTIRGGGFFSTADTNLDGDPEIWTDDTAAVNGFEGLAAAQIKFIPTYVLQFDDDRLLDASPQFQPYFDDVIRKVHSEIKSGLLHDFKLSDGKLQARVGMSVAETVRQQELLRAKIQVLEIVWAYLYSGREQEAWRTLEEMWPAGDVTRIRGEIVSARERGIRSQLDGVWQATGHKRRKAPIYEQAEVKPAQAILMRIYPPAEAADAPLGQIEVRVGLVIDSAGKVRSVSPAGNKEKLDVYVEASVEQWKFIPAFRHDRAVASRMKTTVWPRR